VVKGCGSWIGTRVEFRSGRDVPGPIIEGWRRRPEEQRVKGKGVGNEQVDEVRRQRSDTMQPTHTLFCAPCTYLTLSLQLQHALQAVGSAWTRSRMLRSLCLGSHDRRRERLRNRAILAWKLFAGFDFARPGSPVDLPPSPVVSVECFEMGPIPVRFQPLFPPF
jgi:hypothetical protein